MATIIVAIMIMFAGIGRGQSQSDNHKNDGNGFKWTPDPTNPWKALVTVPSGMAVRFKWQYRPNPGWTCVQIRFPGNPTNLAEPASSFSGSRGTYSPGINNSGHDMTYEVWCTSKNNANNGREQGHAISWEPLSLDRSPFPEDKNNCLQVFGFQSGDGDWNLARIAVEHAN